MYRAQSSEELGRKKKRVSWIQPTKNQLDSSFVRNFFKTELKAIIVKNILPAALIVW